MPEEGRMKIKELPVKFKAGPKDGLADGEFIAYPSTFTREPDSYGDVVAKGAFLDSIKEWVDSGNTLPGLYGHRMDSPHMNIAGASEMGEDDHGWWVKGSFDLDPEDDPSGEARKTYKLVTSGRISQLSFAYDTLDEGEVELEDGRKANELRKLKVYQRQCAPVGANQDTSVVAIKSAVDALATSELKAGRVLAAKHIDSLRSAQEAIGAVITAAEAANDQEKASAEAEAKTAAVDKEPEGAKSAAVVEEPKSTTSAKTLATLSILSLLSAGEGDSQ